MEKTTEIQEQEIQEEQGQEIQEEHEQESQPVKSRIEIEPKSIFFSLK